MANLSPRVIFNFEQIFNRTVNRTELNRFSTSFNQMKYQKIKPIENIVLYMTQ